MDSLRFFLDGIEAIDASIFLTSLSFTLARSSIMPCNPASLITLSSWSLSILLDVRSIGFVVTSLMDLIHIISLIDSGDAFVIPETTIPSSEGPTS